MDLFCGAGGLTHGFVMEGFRVLAGIDTDKTCRYPFETNNVGAEFIASDVRDLSANDLAGLYPKNDIKILVGCAPCQPFSLYNGGNRKKDDKWQLLYRFAHLIQKVRPHVVSMENVPALKKFDNGKVLQDFLSSLEKCGYTTKTYEIYCPDYGIPQEQTRLVCFGSLFGTVSMIPPTCNKNDYKTVAETIKYIPPISAGETSIEDPLHRAASLSELNMERIRQSEPGGTWRDWDPGIRAKCHRVQSGKSYPSVYGRMSWDKPAPTMTTFCYGYGNGRFGHPEQDRAISLREAALFQTFPKNYRFVEPGQPYKIKTLGRLIGNAVPVQLGRVIAKSIYLHLQLQQKYKTT